jgi:hypothetical protein
VADAFGFDEAKAREWLARGRAQNENPTDLADVDYDDSIPEVAVTWQPRDDEYGAETAALADAAVEGEIITCPPGASLIVDYGRDQDEAGFRVMVRLRDLKPEMLLAGPYETVTWVYPPVEYEGFRMPEDGTGLCGDDAAVVLLAGMVNTANELLTGWHKHTSGLRELAAATRDLDARYGGSWPGAELVPIVGDILTRAGLISEGDHDA